jgi:hypothetical protein
MRKSRKRPAKPGEAGRGLKLDRREMRAIERRIADLEAKGKRGPLTARQKELLEGWRRMRRAVRFDMSAKKNG